MLSKKEIKLINFIKYTPILIVIFICISITFLLYIDKNIVLQKDLKILQKEYLDKNKEMIKDEVNKVYDYISHKKLNSEEELKKDIKNRVLEAHSVMTYIYEKYKNIETKEQITNRIKDSLRELKFNDNRGYFYIYSMDGYNILHPLLPNLENRNILNFKNEKVKEVFLNIKKDLEIKDESYTNLFWEKPEDLSKESQLSHIKPSCFLV